MGARVVGVKQAWSRRLALKAMVRQDGVIGQQPGRQFPITGRPGLKQEGLRIIRERGLERAVEPFHVGGPVRGPGGGPPVGEATCLEAAVEVPLELSAIIGKHGARGGGEQRAEGIQGMGGLAAGGGGKGDGEPEVRSEEREPRAVEPGVQPHDGITGEHLQRRPLGALRGPEFAGPGEGVGASPGIEAGGGGSLGPGGQGRGRPPAC